MLVLDYYVVGLTCLNRERLVLGLATKSEETTTATCLSLFYYLAIYLQHVAVVGGQGVLHLASKG